MISEAMLSYYNSVAERKRLIAADCARPLQNRLLHLQPLHNELYEEYSKTLEQVGAMEEELALLRKSEAQLKVSQMEAVSLRGKLRGAEMELLEIKSTTQSSAAELVDEKNIAIIKLADAQLEYQLVKDKSAALEAQVAELKEYFGSSEKVMKAEIANYKKQLKSLQITHEKALERAVSEREELESQNLQLKTEKAAAEAEIGAVTEKQESAKVFKKEISDLRATIAKDKKALEKAEKDAEAAFAKVQELSELRTNLENEIEARTQAEKQHEEERNARKQVEKDLERLQAAREKAPAKESAAKGAKKEITELKATLEKEIQTRQKAEEERDTEQKLREQVQKEQEEEQKAREKAEKDLERMRASKEKAPVKGTKKELSDLKSALDKEIEAREQAERERAEEAKIREKAEKDLERLQEAKSAKEPAAKVSKKEVTELKASLGKEAKAREKAEREFARFKVDHEAKLGILERQLEAARANVKKIEGAGSKAPMSKTTTTKIPLDNPRKRPASNHLTMDDLENSVKRPRNKQPKESGFSITPFLKRQALVIDGDLAAAGDATAALNESSMGGAGERSMIIPSVIDSKQPTRLLFAGAGWKKKPTKAPGPILEEMEEASALAPVPKAPLPVLAQLEEEEEDFEEEDSMLMVSAPITARGKGKAPAKPRGKAAAKAPAVAKAKPVKPRNTLLDSSPVASSAEKPTAKKAATKPRRKVGAETSLRGIKPTSFDDDGTGRIRLNFDNASQPSKVSNLVPRVGTFKKEISPPKKRPAGMKLFGKQ